MIVFRTRTNTHARTQSHPYTHTQIHAHTLTHTESHIHTGWADKYDEWLDLTEMESRLAPLNKHTPHEHGEVDPDTLKKGQHLDIRHESGPCTAYLRAACKQLW